MWNHIQHPQFLFRHLTRANPDFNVSEYKKKFASLKTNRDRINIVYEDMSKYNLFPEVVVDAKDDAVSVRHRENGNKSFGVGRHMQALEHYTLSVATAKSKTVLALAYANRSACLFKLNLYKTCIEEIDRALANNYPDNLKEKLINRRKQAEKLQKPLEKYHEEIPQIPDSQRNLVIQCASNCVEIKSDQEFGRHIVATRDIQIGEVLSVEKPYACVLRGDHLVHCHHCLQLCYNVLPCKSCTQALYCSETCKEEALNSYHTFECPILLSLIKWKLDWILIALKVAILAKADYENLNFVFKEKECYRSDRYKEIHNLSTHVEKIFNDEFFIKTVGATSLFHLIKTKTEFLENNKMEEVFKEVLLFQVLVASNNGLIIYEYKLSSDLIDYGPNDFAGGIYSFSSLYNHSCCRNLFRAYYGSTLVIRAINTIKKGQQCFINYGAHYDFFPKMERQMNLHRNFAFTCKCRACEEDWEKHLVPFPKAIHLPMFSQKTLAMQEKISKANVRFVKEFLPRIISLLKECESEEPHGNALTLKRLLEHCYQTLGNKRRIL